MDPTIPAFLREETITPTDSVFDVDESEVRNLWKGLDSFREKETVREVRIPPLPDVMLGAGVARNMGQRVRQLKVTKAFLVTDPFLFKSGKAEGDPERSWRKAASRRSSFPRWNPIRPSN